MENRQEGHLTIGILPGVFDVYSLICPAKEKYYGKRGPGKTGQAETGICVAARYFGLWHGNNHLRIWDCFPFGAKARAAIDDRQPVPVHLLRSLLAIWRVSHLSRSQEKLL
jgi:hypothetical protein